jgi:dihydrofolate synthase/folylpolyglutamate synthase
VTGLPRVGGDYLKSLISYEQSGRVEHPTTSRVAALTAALGNPHRSYPAIHVTGTNGKGSTTAMIASLLTAHGLRVGTYTSPHVHRLAERVTVDGQAVEDQELTHAIGQVERAAAAIGITPSWFEAMTAAGLYLLAAREVALAVVEVGMLGRWDATNIVDGRVAVVTNVHLDHMDMAGPTRAAIAREKAGIVKPGATLILGEQDPSLRSIFEAQNPARILTRGRELRHRNRRRGPTGSVVDLTNPWGTRAGIHVGMCGQHQCDNALLALSAAEAFLDTAMPAGVISRALADTHVAGRFDIVHREPTVVLDGAHNPAAAAALRRALDENIAAKTPRILLCGTLTGRDPVEFLEGFGMDGVNLVVATEPDSPRALPAAALAEAARSCGVAAAAVVSPIRALDEATAAAGVEGVVIATGSLYLVGVLRAAMRTRMKAVAP